MLLVLILMIVLGASAGSFASAWAWRLHEGLDFIRGRSQCPACKHQLAAGDLIPLLSFAINRGRCRYCQAKISKLYPAAEALGIVWFVSSYLFWPASLQASGQIVLFVSWLLASTGLIGLLIYDHRWMILPNKIIYPALLVAATGQAIYSLGFAPSTTAALLSWLGGVAIASGIFFILHEVSRGQWIGFGDVRLGLITGSLLADPGKAVLMILLASVGGIVLSLPHVARQKKSLNSRISFGPFLIISAGLVMLFGGHFLSWYSANFIR